MVAHQEDAGRLLRRCGRPAAERRRALARAASQVPIGEAGRTLLGRGRALVGVLGRPPRPRRPVLGSVRLTEALDRVAVPVLLFSGWQDLFLEQSLAQFRHLRDRGVTTALTVGPWTHTQLMTKGAPTVLRESLAWLDAHLGGKPAAPQPGAGPRHGRRLARAAGLAARDAGTRAVSAARAPTFGDAADGPARRRRSPSTPPIRRRRSAAGCSHPRAATATTRALALRPDVADFTGDPLPTDLYVVGTPVVELSIPATTRYNDLFVRLSEVDAQGRSTNVSDGFVRLQPIPDGPARTRRGGAPLRGRLADPGAGGGRLAPALRPQPRHRRAADLGTRWRPRRTPCTTARADSHALVLPAGPTPPSGD